MCEDSESNFMKMNNFVSFSWSEHYNKVKHTTVVFGRTWISLKWIKLDPGTIIIIIISGFTSAYPPSGRYDVAWQQCLSKLPYTSIHPGLLLGRGWTPGDRCGWLPPRSFLADLLEFGLRCLGLTPWQSMHFHALCGRTISGVYRWWLVQGQGC